MYSIQEMIDKTEKQRKQIKEAMDHTGIFHPEDASIFTDQKRSVGYGLVESLKRLSLSRLLEYLTKSGTTGTAGAAYLVPDTVASTLFYASKKYDIAPLISAKIFTEWSGGKLQVPIIHHDQFKAKMFMSGGGLPEETPQIAQASITPESFGINIAVTNDMIEDNNFSLIEFLVEKAGERVADKASDLLLTDMANGGGEGTMNTEAASSDETTPDDIWNAFDACGQDDFKANTMIITPEAWTHSVCGVEVAGGTAGDYWRGLDGVMCTPTAAGFDLKYHVLDTLFSTAPFLHAATDAAGAEFTNCGAYVFDRNNAVIVGRKRWLELGNYSDPVRGLAGAVVSSRQGASTLYDDAICKITET